MATDRTKIETFQLSIEPTEGPTFMNGFHLGTDERLARQIAADRFHTRNKNGYPTRTVALILGRKLIDCYDGQWSSECT